MPEEGVVSEDDIAETYLAWLKKYNDRTHQGYIDDVRNQIYQDGKVNVGVFPPIWRQNGKLSIPVWANPFFTKAPRWDLPVRPSYPPKDYETIIQTDAPMWLHQLISPKWIDTALLDKHWEKGFEYRWNLASSGRNVWVYVFDTGIDISNPEFENRATNGWAFDGHLDYQDKYGHGTACASQIGGKTFGVAKKVNIVSIRVLNDDGPDLTKSVDGMKHVLLDCQTHKQPCVISMSLGILDEEMATKAYQQAKKGHLSKQATAPVSGMVALVISLEGNLEPLHMKEKIKRMALYGKIPNLGASHGDYSPLYVALPLIEVATGGGNNLRAYIPPEIYTRPTSFTGPHP
ncbi:hypothetical protein H0H93_000413 [Arthromyces matolae]|nr:hypothetical protein H0H93_000413 [Arthromyces matolae]